MDIQPYLDRIHYTGPLNPTPDTLRGLHLAHMRSVPFENLSIHWGEPIRLDVVWLYDKIVRRKRGGFCYELNGLFGWLLQRVGFDVTYLSAGVMSGDGSFGPDFDHMALLVRSDRDYLADVGFGDSFVQPLYLDTAGPQIDLDGRPCRAAIRDGRAYRIVRQAGDHVMQQRDSQGEWQPQYCFTLTPRRLPDYQAMCHYHQTSPDSPFTRKRVCSRATPDGRVTLSNLRLIITSNGSRQERPLQDETEFDALLGDLFGIRAADGGGQH